MLKSLELENFKAFGERVKIPFAPITLIFGENSSGKSSILQSLNLLKQTRESREAGALLLPRTEQGISDLGSFQDLLFDHDLKRNLTIKINTTFEDCFFPISDFPNILLGNKLFKNQDTNEISVELNFCRVSLEEDTFLNEIKFSFDDKNKYIARFKTITNILEAPEELLDIFPHLYDEDEHNSTDVECQLPIVKCVYITDELKIWESRFEFCKQNRIEILKFLQKLLLEQQDYIKNNKSKPIKWKDIVTNKSPKVGLSENKKFFKSDPNIFKKSFENMEKQALLDNAVKLEELVKDAISFYSLDFDINQFISRMQAEYQDKCIEMEGFLPTVAIERNPEIFLEEMYINSSFKNDLYSKQQKVFTLDFRKLAIFAGKVLKNLLKNLFPLGPLRKSPERWYIFTGTSPQDVGYKGELLPDLLFRRPELIEEANNWLDRLDIGYRLKVQPLGERTKDLFEVQLIDTRRKPNIEVGLPDVGFGISQLLPFIVQSLASQRKIISIEQPEVHIHPRLQADLGDLLAETIKSPRNNQFIIETHSEHLVLRLQKLVSEKKLSPDDVSIIYVSRGADGSKVQQLQLDKDGDFIDDWPGGFFPERLRELR